jgi:hypothetical protein
MSWQAELNGYPLDWLLEDDASGVRYLALRDLLDVPADDPALVAARHAAYSDGPIAGVLAAMQPEGYWSRPGPGYNPKYRSTVWALTLLAQLGASIDEDSLIGGACAYLLDHALTPGGQFSASGAPSGTIDCLQGNLCWALTMLGCRDLRLPAAFEWMARTVTGEDMAPAGDSHAPRRYYSYKCGPSFACGVNDGKPCAWGAVKVMLAFGALPAGERAPLVQRAVEQGAGFLLGTDPAGAGYPTRRDDRPSRNWWKFGFPVFYVTDILQIVEALAALGYGHDPRLADALAFVRSKQGADCRWLLEYDYAGKTWGDFGAKKQPNKWVTLRALRALKRAAEETPPARVQAS